MATEISSVWAVDLGNNSLKALRLSNTAGVIEVIDFDVIEHGKILSGKGVEELERQELIALTLRRFFQNHSFDKDPVIISLPSQNSFARFVNLPPVESKKIPEIIRFEAVQQIPFDINDVQWDWQLMEKDSGGENRVGIFAIKNDVINSTIEHFQREDVQIRFIQMSPMALYNYAIYDRTDLAQAAADEAIVVLNIGAEYTDLVVCTKSSVWQRCIPMGGNAFTKAIADAFKIPFEKAEKLKRNATTSKYARQILQAMKPVFSNFASEIQRSTGFYSSSNPKTRLVKMIALGGCTRMRGLLKYLQQSIQMPIERPDSFEKLPLSPDVSAAKFHDCVCDLGIVYGLGLQALGMAKIESNLLPRNIARSMMWASKAKYFYVAAFVLLLVSALAFLRVIVDKASYSGKKPIRTEIEAIISDARRAEQLLREEQAKEPLAMADINREFSVFQYRDVIASLMQTILSALPNETNNRDQAELYRAFEAGDVEKLTKTERGQRKQIFITGMSIHFVEDLSTSAFDEQTTGARLITSTVSAGPGVSAAAAKQRGLDELARMRSREAVVETPTEQTEQPEETQIQPQAAQSNAGFIVTIVGYSPYKDISRLFDPLGVGQDRSQWGFITRLKNLDKISDVNSFVLFDANSIQNFTYKIDEISFLEGVPAGIGIISQRVIEVKKDSTAETGRISGLGPTLPQGNKITENILIDPMTHEIIDKVVKYNEDGTRATDNTGRVAYEVNDHWFEIKAKFLWKNAPPEIIALAQKL
jgi:type IV pilus assembly protein PilM